MPRRSSAPVRPRLAPPADSIAAARAAGLRYVNETIPGVQRVARGRNAFAYRGPDGKSVRDAATLGRIKRLAIPPAWTGVWICPSENGHIQATGRDARGRKQYRYHPDWREVRDETKYERTLAFGRALPRIRRRVARDLAAGGHGRRKVLAAMVRLLESTLIRVGNEEYARNNRSFGLSTMRDRHVRIRPGRGELHFRFRGKSGKHHEIDLHDPQLARIVKRAQDLPGQDLFQFRDETGVVQKIRSEDVNAYLREIAGADYSAKDFRTWAGTVLAAIALQQFAAFDTKAEAKRNIVAAIERVAARLGNTPAICRRCYVHPVVLESYLAGSTVEVLRAKTQRVLRQDLAKLSAAEGAVLAFLQQRLRAKSRRPAPSLRQALRASVRTARSVRSVRLRRAARGKSRSA